jgi:adenylate cyclase
MQQKERRPTMPDNTSPEAWLLPELTRARRAIVVVDVVESVRLMQEDETGFIERWRRFVGEVVVEVLPRHGGRLVKSLGDGLLLEFGDIRAAVNAAQRLHERAAGGNRTHAGNGALTLRAAVHVADVVIDALDIYGAGVNLTARLASLAQGGQTVLSVEVKEALIEGIDVRAKDLGECYVKHLDKPVRAFVVLDDAPAVAPLARPSGLRPHLVVLPLTCSSSDAPVAAVLTDDLVRTLASSGQWTVMSRLSTSMLAGAGVDELAVTQRLSPDFLLTGACTQDGDAVELSLSLRDTRSQQVVCSGVQRGRVQTALAGEHRLVSALCASVAEAVLTQQLRLARTAALPNLPGYALMLAAVALTHRLGADDFIRAQSLLESLTERHPRSPEARAWAAMWHFLQVAQRRTDNTQQSLAQAEQHLSRALDEEPAHALALALSGHLSLYGKLDANAALPRLQAAVVAGPNESLAWLFLANALGATGQGLAAVAAIDTARGLSPMDPLGYYYEIFAASAYSAAGRHEQALAFAQRSIDANAMHLSSWVQLIIEQVLTNRMDDARQTAQHYLAMRPMASVQRFLDTHVARGTPLARRDADALLLAGLPH